jgi:hypothetical protein
MIEEGPTMTTPGGVHRLVDKVPEDRLADVLGYLCDLQDTDEALSEETKAAIEEGLADIRHGRTISLEDYRRARKVGIHDEDNTPSANARFSERSLVRQLRRETGMW